MINWIDFVILIVFAAYVWDGYHRGFLRLAWELVGILVAFVFASKFYAPVATLLKTNFFLSDIYIKPIGFLIVWFLAQFVFYIAGHYLSFYTPSRLKVSKTNHYLGLIPAAIKGIIFIAVLLTLVMILPTSTNFRTTVSESLIGGVLVNEAAKLENKLEVVFIGSDTGTNTLTSTSPSENSKLDFKTTDVTIDEQLEKQMLSLVNIEREKAGVAPLAENILVRNVARSHSRDMLIRGYFSHNALTGETLADRLQNAKVTYVTAAENIAMAPTIQLAHNGLMNSPKHKANILDPSFTSVGIGVVDAGQYGLMVTQDFIK